MPGPIQLIDLGFGQPVYAEPGEDFIQDEPVQLIDAHPRQFGAPHAVHRGPVTGAPSIGECGPVHLQPLARRQRPAFADEATTPVHDRAENIEQQCAYGVQRCKREKEDRVWDGLYGPAGGGQSHTTTG